MKNYDKLKELLDWELGDLPHFSYRIYVYDEDNISVFYDVNISIDEQIKNTVRFRVSSEKIEVMVIYDYKEIDFAEPSIKYFWIALLS